MPQRELRNSDVMTEIIKRNADTVYRLAYLRTGSTHDAEDIMQEVFIRFVKSNPAFDSREHEKAWFIKVAINRTKSFFASAWNKHTVFTPDGDLPVSWEDKSDDFVLQTVLSLPKDISTAVHLYYYENLPVKEICHAMGKSESAVKSLLFRGRKLLRLELSDADI